MHLNSAANANDILDASRVLIQQCENIIKDKKLVEILDKYERELDASQDDLKYIKKNLTSPLGQRLLSSSNNSTLIKLHSYFNFSCGFDRLGDIVDWNNNSTDMNLDYLNFFSYIIESQKGI